MREMCSFWFQGVIDTMYKNKQLIANAERLRGRNIVIIAVVCG